MQFRLVVVTLILLGAFMLHGISRVSLADEKQVGASSHNNGVRYLVDESELPEVAAKYGLDEEALERLKTAHHHLAEHQAKPKPDPVETNGPVFVETVQGKVVDWPKPDAALMFTGEQIGYLEPCGCAGLENQKGGLKRRHTLVKKLRDEQGWPLALFDSGEQVRYFGPQAEIKQRYSLESLIQLGYHAVGFGPKDLRTDLLGTIINFEESENPLTSANVGVLDFDSGFTKRWKVIELEGGVRVGVTSVMADKAREELTPSDDIVTLSATEALTDLLPTIKAAACDQNVLMVYGDKEEASELARSFDHFDWVVAGTGSDEPPHMANKIEGTTRGGGSVLIEVGHKGMYAVVIGLYRKPDAGGKPGEGWFARYQKTPLDHRWPDSPEMHQRLVEYQSELQALGWEGLGLRPAPHPTEKAFAGSAICGDCHTEAWDVFEATPHFHTTETLVALSPARHFDPECISCHSVGWQAQKYFPFATGWLGYSETPEKFSQGCENCHGPAARHAAVEMGDIDVDEAEELSLRKALHMEIAENEGNKSGQVLSKVVNNCMQCHDLDNSPDFDFQEYWEGVKHHGVD